MGGLCEYLTPHISSTGEVMRTITADCRTPPHPHFIGMSDLYRHVMIHTPHSNYGEPMMRINTGAGGTWRSSSSACCGGESDDGCL